MEKATEKKVWALLKRCHKQLEAMNCSEAHAASWVKPRSNATTLLVKRLANILKEQPKEHVLDREARLLCKKLLKKEDNACTFCGQVHLPMRKDRTNTRVCNKCWKSWEHNHLYKEFKIVGK